MDDKPNGYIFTFFGLCNRRYCYTRECSDREVLRCYWVKEYQTTFGIAFVELEGLSYSKFVKTNKGGNHQWD